MSDDTLRHDDSWDGTRSEGPGSRIGPYLLVSRIGEGGFGDVYEADQSVPVKRRVAMKILKLGMDTREVIGRFALERQALAMMEHPHIARVLDAGATESGRPYFVMELVAGEPITLYCDKLALPVEERLKLFEQVCAAVQHAHTKGVIHRDLKPGNILVSTHDGKHYAKVIDFGIAKAVSGDLSERTQLQAATRMDQVVGTPLYMSPEQARGSADIDTRSDIYALGVILYELLTGSTPVERTKLLAISLADTQRLICETEPPVPSARLAKAAVTATGTIGYHATEARTLARKVRGELDWIVMKAIEKDRSRRYDTASAFADDVRRYLDGEPVLAAPPSAAYRFGKFVRRNKGSVAAAAAVALALLVGLAGFAWQAHVAQQQERLAKQRADQLEQVADFQEAMLAQFDPQQAGEQLTGDVSSQYAKDLAKEGVAVADRASMSAAFAKQWHRINATDAAIGMVDRSILKPAAAEIDTRFRTQPVVAAKLQQVLADSYVRLGLYDAALPLQRSALKTRRQLLGGDHKDVLLSINNMGILLEDMGRSDDAMTYFREALDKARHALGNDDEFTLTQINNMGLLLMQEGKLGQAEPYLREAVERMPRVLGEDNDGTLKAFNNLGLLLQQQGKLDQAEPYFRQALATARRLGDTGDPESLVIMINNMGLLMQKQGKLAQAEPYYQEALAKARRLWGNAHPNTLQILYNSGLLYVDENKPQAAEPLLREALEGNRRLLGDVHPATLNSITAMAGLLVLQHHYAEAEKLLAPAEVAIRKAFTGDELPRAATFLLAYGNARAGLGEFRAAEANLLEAHSIFETALGKNDPHSRKCTQSLVDFYTAWNASEPGQHHDAEATKWKTLLAQGNAASQSPAK